MFVKNRVCFSFHVNHTGCFGVAPTFDGRKKGIVKETTMSFSPLLSYHSPRSSLIVGDGNYHRVRQEGVVESRGCC